MQVLPLAMHCVEIIPEYIDGGFFRVYADEVGRRFAKIKALYKIGIAHGGVLCQPVAGSFLQMCVERIEIGVVLGYEQ